MIYSKHRPPGHERRGDSYLAPTLKKLRRVLGDAQRGFAYDTLRLNSASLDAVAGILVDFAEDLHNGIGIWEAYERYNNEFFGAPLPLVATDDDGGDVRAIFHPNRFRHLLWVLYPVFVDRLVLSPSHQDLQRIAQASSEFLAHAFTAIPKDSGVKTFQRPAVSDQNRHANHPFKRGQLIFGSLTPWRGEWYWSGEQRVMEDASQVDIAGLIQTMKRTNSRIVCRYSKDYEAQIRQRASKLHDDMLAYSGKDLVVYPDGMSMAADWQKELQANWDSRPKQEIKKVIEKYDLVRGRPEINIPRDLLERKDGLGVFLNPDEGKEIMTHFTSLLAGLTKKGNGLTKDEEDAIRGFVNADSVSPRFVKRVLEEFGDESVKAAFLLKGDLPGYWLDYLVRARKGIYYRKRYPSISVV